MGTTLTALKNDPGIEIGWVLAIEGYEYLITDRGDQLAALVTAWAADPDWSSALGGLTEDGEFEDAFDPWSGKFPVQSRTFRIDNTGEDDHFGKATHQAAGATRTKLNTDLEPNGGTIHADRADDFDASGDLFIGPERIGYGARNTSTDQFTTLTRGKYSPFAVDGGSRFARPHYLGDVDFDVQHKPWISTQPESWIGRYVGLWVHRIVGGVWDVKAQAELTWAGVIVDVRDSPSLATVITCEDVRKRLRDTVLMSRQYRGRVAKGVVLTAGMKLTAKETRLTSGTSGTASESFTVVSGASGTSQIEPGRYEADELLAALNNWLGASSLTGLWSFVTVGTNEGTRNFLIVSASGTTWQNFAISLRATGGGSAMLRTLGWEGAWELTGHDAGSSIAISIQAPGAPIKAYPYVGGTITVEATVGDWFNNRDWLPEPWRSQYTASGENWGVVRIGNVMLLAKYTDDATLDLEISGSAESLMRAFGLEPSGWFAATVDDDYELEVRQIAIIQGSLLDVLGRLFGTTGAATAYNHATYDDPTFGRQFGAGIPWSLLGSAFVTSLEQLEQASTQNAITLVVEKPTSLAKQIMSDLIIRGAQLIWKDGGYVFAQQPTPNAELAVHSLTEDNKAMPVGVQDMQITATDRTDAFVRNVIKIAYNRSIDGSGYKDNAEFRHQDSINRYGEKVLTIEMRNAWGHFPQGAQAVEDLAFYFLAYVLPLYAHPLRQMRRTIDYNSFLAIHPGDIVTLTDDYVRDETDGTRGIAGKPCWVQSRRHDWGGSGGELFGEVTLLALPLDDAAVYAPSANVNDGAANAGYAADTPSGGQSTLTTIAHDYSESSEANDNTRFVAGDAVRVIERDNTSPTTWTANVVSTGTNTIVLDSNLASFDTTGATLYKVVYDDYASCQSTQLTKAFQADDADSMVADTRRPFVWASSPASVTFSSIVATDLPERMPTTLIGDGEPVSSADHHAVARMVNNLVSYKTTPAVSQLQRTGLVRVAADDRWALAEIIPFPVPRGVFTSLLRTKIYLAPMISAPDGASGDVAVKITAAPTPTGTTSILGASGVTFPSVAKSVTFVPGGTAYAIPAAQTLPLIPGPDGVCYLHVEIRGETTGSLRTRFLSLAYGLIGPLE